MEASPNSAFKVSSQVLINGHPANALLDSGSTDKSLISDDFAKALRIHQYSASGYVCMATSSLKSGILGDCLVEMKLQDRIYEDVRFTILEDLCTDVILGTEFQEQHESIVIKYGGDEPSLTFCALASLAAEPPFLSANLTRTVGQFQQNLVDTQVKAETSLKVKQRDCCRKELLSQVTPHGGHKL